VATDSLWVFGYGSLVSPVSMASTIGRVVKPRNARARDEQRAAVRRSYGDLVERAFRSRGPRHLGECSRTPAPDVAVMDFA
jgi:hypothetical protein